MLFAGLVPIVAGKATLEVELPESFGDYLVEAFAIAGLTWRSAEARVRADKVPMIALDLPAFVHAADTAVGRVTARVSSDRMKVRVQRDGVDVPLLGDGATVLQQPEIAARSVELSFLVSPGNYTATVEDAVSAERDSAERRVDEPGKLRRVARTVRLLEPGDRVSRADDPSVIALRVLPGVDRPFRALVSATADYGHACCEQTAAKMLAACAMYVFADRDASARAAAEAIIVAGVRREQLMHLPAKGFKMYPESAARPDTYWGPKAARHLFNLGLLRDAGGQLSPWLTQAVEQGLAMARDAATAYGLAFPPSQISSCEDAYLALRFGGPRDAALRFVLAFTGPSSHAGAVAQRVELAYAAATLLRSGDRSLVARALPFVNRVTRDFGDHGRLYSTVDSVAAIAMMAELRAAGVVASGSADVEIDGRTMPVSFAASLDAPPQSVAARTAVVPLEVTRVVEEDWSTYGASIPLRIALERSGRPARSFSVGDAVDLRLTLPSGYTAGDIAWICLPDALSRVVGGGQVKRFSVDFNDRAEIVVSLAATGITVDRAGQLGSQRFAVCVRNMFDEERCASAGLLEVSVQPEGGDSAVSRVLRGLRGLLGG